MSYGYFSVISREWNSADSMTFRSLGDSVNTLVYPVSLALESKNDTVYINGDNGVAMNLFLISSFFFV